ncbi:M20 family peptidase [Candidatus Nitrospira bockiana]
MIGRAIQWLVITVVVLGLVLAGRALTVVSRQLPPVQVPLIRIDGHAAAERLAAAVRFKTISYQDPAESDRTAFLALHDYLSRAFPASHRVLEREVVGRYSLLYTWPGSDPSLAPILLLGHLDVVPVEPGTEREWTQPPFAGVVADGFVWGRGTMDDKPAVCGPLEAIELLVRDGVTPRRTVLLAFGHDEEIGGEAGAKEIAAHLLRRGVRPAIVLDEGMAILRGLVPGVDRPVAAVGIAEKGYVTFELAAQGEGGHASMPPRETSVGILAAAIRRVEAEAMAAHLEGPAAQFFDFLAPELPWWRRLVLANRWLFEPAIVRVLDTRPPTRALIRTTFAPTMLEASAKENVLAPRARALVNVRVHPEDRIQAAFDHLQRVVADSRVTIRSVGTLASEPSPESPVDSAAFAALQRTVTEVFPDVVVAPGLVLGATDARHYQPLTGPVYRFLPISLAPGDPPRIHGTDECLSIDDYTRLIQFYGRLIQSWDG